MASVSRRQKKALLGKKLGMTQLFEEDGGVVPVTVLQAGPCSVVQVKTAEKDGYAAVQLGFDSRRKQAKRPEQARFDQAGVETKRWLREVPWVDPSDIRTGAPAAAPSGEEGEADSGAEAEAEAGGEVRPGVEIGVELFEGVAHVDVQGVSKGRGFAGTIKRHGFQRGDAGHGSKNVREPGSTGQHTDPGRVFKGKRMPGHYGHAKQKVRNLEVVRIDAENDLLVVRGSIPGPNGGYVYIEESLDGGRSS